MGGIANHGARSATGNSAEVAVRARSQKLRRSQDIAIAHGLHRHIAIAHGLDRLRSLRSQKVSVKTGALGIANHGARSATGNSAEVAVRARSQKLRRSQDIAIA